MGSHLSNPNHHLKVKAEMRGDLQLWLTFLNSPATFARPFFHFDSTSSRQLFFYTDASRNPELGCGGVCDNDWFIMQWERPVKTFDLSIAYLELYAVVVAVFLWIERFKNTKISIFCDNQSVIYMINNSTSSCKQCMVLIRLMVLHCVKANVKLTARYVTSKNNKYADMLSRLKYKSFKTTAKQEGQKFNNRPQNIPEELLPMSKLIV